MTVEFLQQVRAPGCGLLLGVLLLLQRLQSITGNALCTFVACLTHQFFQYAYIVDACRGGDA